MNGVVIRLFITKKTAHAAGSGTGKWYPVEAMAGGGGCSGLLEVNGFSGHLHLASAQLQPAGPLSLYLYHEGGA